MDVALKDGYRQDMLATLHAVPVSAVLAGRAPSGWSDGDAASAAAIADHVRGFLSSAHPMLGRSGPVCPFASGAVRGDFLKIAVSKASAGEPELLMAELVMLHQIFDDLVASIGDPGRRIFASAALALPLLTRPDMDPDARDMIDEVQRRLKPDFVTQGKMIGQFYPGCPMPGIRNLDFRPLDAPMAFIAIRHMTLEDAPFMLDQVAFQESYLLRFGNEGAKRLKLAHEASLRADGVLPS